MDSPCIDICTMNPESGLCSGCGRTIDEIAGWSLLSDTQRRSIMEALPDRMRIAKLVPEPATAKSQTDR